MIPTKVIEIITVFLYHFETMKQKLWITLITYIAYCIDKELYNAIDYLKTQVEVLIEHQEKQNKRIILTNSQRIRVAAKAKKLSRKMLEQCTVLFCPDTIIGWYNKLIAEKYDGTRNRGKVGRPPITLEIVNLVIKFKKENPRWRRDSNPSMKPGFASVNFKKYYFHSTPYPIVL